MLMAMRGPTPPGQDPREVIEALGAVLHAIARKDATSLIEILDKNDAPPDPELVVLVGALASGRKEQVVGPLIRALKHRNAFVRWAAVSSLVRLRTRKAVEPLTVALSDRSTWVKGEVVRALISSKFYRTTAAIEPLRRIVRNQRIKRQLPGMWRQAKTALEMLVDQGKARHAAPPGRP